jgi:tetratricopeptide (TPR) repeat protein
MPQEYGRLNLFRSEKKCYNGDKMKNKCSRAAFVLMTGLLTAMMFIGCSSGGKLDREPSPVKMTESMQREYNYALTEATKQKLFGNFKQAAALYMKCVEVNPSSDVAHFQLAGIYMIGRDYNAARKMNLKATQLAPDNYWYKIQLSQLYLMAQMPDSAALVYEDIIKRWPDKIEVKYELCRLYSEIGKTARALKMLNDIEKENGISEPVSMLKEQIYAREGKYDMAIDELNALIEVAPEDIRYLGILAELYTSIERKEDAKATYKRIFEIEPDNGIAQLSMAEFYRLDKDREKQFEYLNTAFRNESLPIDRKMGVLIEFLTDEHQFRESEDEIDSLISLLMQIYPEDYRVKTARADFLSRQEKYEEALEVYKEVLEVQKGNYFIWEQTIFIENILGNTESVYDRCTEALKFFDDKPFLYLLKGNAAMQMDKNVEAIESLETGLKFVENNIPMTVQFYSFIAEAWRNLGQYDKSDKYFEDALQMEPENAMILNNYGYYLALREEKLELAEKMSRKTIEAEPENATYLDTYSWILFKSGRIEEARIYMERAISHGGAEDPDILEHYGDILNRLGHTEEALKYWNEAKDKGGDSEELDRKINE